jgi:hypothetical protein
MIPDREPVPAAPTPRTPAQIAAIHGRNAVEPPTCTWWHWRNGIPAMCWKTESHHQRETDWSVMSHQDPTGGVQGPWFDSDDRSQ